VKHRLAGDHSDDREAYTAAKTEFILRVGQRDAGAAERGDGGVP
jgi:GrpB-like predicted nucleotidyltransferase (UPF0157 family)